MKDLDSYSQPGNMTIPIDDMKPSRTYFPRPSDSSFLANLIGVLMDTMPHSRVEADSG